jgi:O-antigen ligase
MVLTYLGLALTYSRSSFLALSVASLYISYKIKKPLISIITIILVIATILILPRQSGEGTKLERTSSIKAKIENYQEGFKTFISSPLIGHGYNNLFYVRQINIPESHSNSGFDGSLLTILATTGLIGFGLFLAGSIYLFQNSSLSFQTLLIALFVHSLFANSLLYPWTLVFLVLI